jgi:hypothetical protein
VTQCSKFINFDDLRVNLDLTDIDDLCFSCENFKCDQNLNPMQFALK